MQALTFYRQERADGAIRTGLEYEGMTILESFEPGRGEPDSVLRWYVDIKCEDKLIPVSGPDHGRAWMVRLKDTIVPVLHNLAKELEATGIDSFLPLVREFRAKKSLRISVNVAGLRREDAHQIAGKLLDIARRWEKLLEGLKPLTLV